MPLQQAITLAHDLQRLELKAPAGLEAAIATLGEARWLGFYWEPDLNYLCYTDGQSVGVGNKQAWHLFCNHPTVKPLLQSYHFGDDYQPAQHYLLLDCVSRQLYVGKSELVDSYLKEPQALALLTILDSPDPSPSASQQPYLHWLKRRSVIIGSVLLLLLGLPIFGFGTAVMMDEADWLEEISESIWQDD